MEKLKVKRSDLGGIIWVLCEYLLEPTLQDKVMCDITYQIDKYGIQGYFANDLGDWRKMEHGTEYYAKAYIQEELKRAIVRSVELT